MTKGLLRLLILISAALVTFTIIAGINATGFHVDILTIRPALLKGVTISSYIAGLACGVFAFKYTSHAKNLDKTALIAIILLVACLLLLWLPSLFMVPGITT